ncbi:MAG: 30S ribosomal protein S15 [Planctomycetota bacterium]|jgi:small subunit ribosomal protein S15
MAMATQQRQELVKQFQQHDSDSGSPQVQVAILTERIKELTEHLRTHKHDFASRRGLLLMVGRRSRLLKHLSRNDREAYRALIKRLGLRK